MYMKYLDGAEDMVNVTVITDGGSYDWAEFQAWYSPSKRRYFWASDTGCSCESWGDTFFSLSDLEDGTKADMMRAVRAYMNGLYSHDPAKVQDEVAKVKRFRYVKGVVA